MEIVQVLALIALFIMMALLMFFRVIPALVALPLMAIQTAVVGGVSASDIAEYVIGQGVLRLHSAYTVTMFGCMLSVLLQRTGVAESFIKRGAELSGDNPWCIAVLMLSAIALLFTTLSGLGAIIMVATIVMPIMSSVGIGPMTIVGIFLFGLSIGGTLNVTNWAVYMTVMRLTVPQIRPFAFVMFAVTFVMALVYITIQLRRDGQEMDVGPFLLKGFALFCFVGLSIAGYRYGLSPDAHAHLVRFADAGCLMARGLIGGCLSCLFLLAAWRAATGRGERDGIHWSSYVSPLFPLFLILLFGVHFVAAFLIGLVYAFVATYRKGRLNLFIQSLFEGGAVAMPAVVLMFGIGMLLVAIMGPGTAIPAYPDGWPVLNLLKPAMRWLVPTGAFSYVLIFAAMAPLALYRGPLNVWGMGYGLAAVFLASGLNPSAVMGLLMSVGQVQGISDPTNTHNVWLANEMRIDVQKVLWNTIPYTWTLAVLGLATSAALYMRG